MFFNDAHRDGQTQPGASLLGGKERVEEPLLNFPGNTLAGINYLQKDDRNRVTRNGQGGASGTKRNGTAPSNTLSRVLNKVNQYLFDLSGVHSNPEVGIPIRLDRRR